MDVLRWLIGQLFVDAAVEATRDGHAAHANRRQPGDPHPTSVTYGWGSKLLGFIACAIVTPLAVLTMWSLLAGRPIDGAWAGGPIFSVIAISFWISLYDHFVRLITWDDTGVRFRKWTGERFVPREDIVGIADKFHPPHTRIAFRDGTGFGIVETMRNSRYFLALLERRLNPEGGPPTKRQRRRRRGRN